MLQFLKMLNTTKSFRVVFFYVAVHLNSFPGRNEATWTIDRDIALMAESLWQANTLPKHSFFRSICNNEIYDRPMKWKLGKLELYDTEISPSD